MAARFPKRYSDVVQRLRVPLGFLLLAAFLVLSRPSLQSVLTSIPVSLAGLLLRAWAAGHLAKNEKLATSGPFRFIRNPLYAGTLLVVAGMLMAGQSWLLALLFALVFLGVYLPVIQQESEHLRRLFPDYDIYARSVPAFIPVRPGPRGPQSFRFDLYLRNQEYQAAIAYAVGLLFLLLRVLGTR